MVPVSGRLLWEKGKGFSLLCFLTPQRRGTVPVLVTVPEKQVPAVPVLLLVTAKIVPLVPVSGSGSVSAPP